MSEFKPNANGKENHCISKLNKEQLTRYMQALSKTVTHTTDSTHTHTHFFPSSNTLLLLYPSISCSVFLSAVGKSEHVRMCTTSPWPQGGERRAWECGRSPLLSGRSLFSRISLASVPSSIRSNLVITPMVLKPVVSHGRENSITQTWKRKIALEI